MINSESNNGTLVTNIDINAIVAQTVTQTIEQITSSIVSGIYNQLANVVQYPQLNTNLDNCTNIIQLPTLNVGGNTVAQKYRQRVIVGVDESGEDIVKWACGDTQAEFQKALYKIMSNSGVYDEPKAKADKTIKFRDYAREWFETFKRPKLRPKTATTRECFLKNHVYDAFGDSPIAEISRMDVQRVLNEKTGLSKAYMRDIMNYMKSIFDAAKEDKIIESNPMDSRFITNPCKRESEREALSEEDKVDIIKHIPELKKRNDRVFVGFLMYTCMRPGEIFALRWEDIDFDNNIIHVVRGSSFDKNKIIIGNTKTFAGVRDHPLHEPLKALLMPFQQEGYIIARDTKNHVGEPYTEQTAKLAWERIKRTINIHGMTPYVGRHTYLTELCADEDVDIKTAMTIAGHADERMLTRKYVHRRDKLVKAAGDKMSARFEKYALA